MIKMFQGFQKEQEKTVFETMFEHRKKIFADEKGWDVNVTDGRFEIDKFDRDDTVYLVCFNEEGLQTGSIRLLSTAHDHMLNGPFKNYFPEIDFQSPLIWEATRFVANDARLQPNGCSRSACEILLGMCRFGLEYGLSNITAVYDAGMKRFYRRCGLNYIEVGTYKTPSHGKIGVGLWEISPDLEQSILNATKLIETLFEDKAA